MAQIAPALFSSVINIRGSGGDQSGRTIHKRQPGQGDNFCSSETCGALDAFYKFFPPILVWPLLSTSLGGCKGSWFDVGLGPIGQGGYHHKVE
ncbi:hypothetical protein JHK86_028924 [Glycine max]|nr:hypothetical protein JHK86_028924 [Glycine max]